MAKTTEPEHLVFEVDSVWDHQTGGKITATKSGYELQFDTPSEWGGNNQALCPDEIFLSSVAGCITTTFVYFCKKMKFAPLDFSLKVTGDVDFQSNIGAYRLTKVNISANLVTEEGKERIGEKCFEFAKDFCHVTKSIDTCIPMEVNLNMQTKAI
jgi:uncharacterized OsmC-like protein